MTENICLIIGATVFITSLAGAYALRHDTKKCSGTVLIGILLATFMLIFPAIPAEKAQGETTGTAYRILSSLLYSFKALGGRQTVSQTEEVGFSGTLRYIYTYLCYAMFFIAPILSSALVISCFGDMGEKLRYALKFKKTRYVFSDLNKNALSVACGIKKSNRRAIIVFCGTKSVEKALITRAKKLGGICLYKSCVDFCTKYPGGHYEFYLVSENEDKNISLAAELIQKKRNAPAGKITVSAFAESGTGIDTVESIKQNNIKLRFIDLAALLCNQLIYEHPLYNTPDGGKNIKLLIIGCGRTGTQMLKTAAWYGQIDGYTLKISVYDNKAEQIREEFFAEAPELDGKEYDIEFIPADINTREFEKKISRELDATLVFIATGDDQLNLSTASRLRGFFRAKSGRFDLNPPILARIRDDFKSENIKSSNYLCERNIIAFGNASDFFEDRMPFETRLEKLALGVHLAYSNKLHCDIRSDEFKNAAEKFYSKEYNRRSSMATALHIPAKLCSCDILKQSEKDLTEIAAENFEKLIKSDEGKVEDLAQNEHRRWNAFFRSEGYKGIDPEGIKKYCLHNNDSHKDPLSRSHPCIVSWEMLDTLSKDLYDLLTTLPENPENEKWNGEPIDFKKYDRDIIRAIPDIIRFANRK